MKKQIPSFIVSCILFITCLVFQLTTHAQSIPDRVGAAEFQIREDDSNVKRLEKAIDELRKNDSANHEEIADLKSRIALIQGFGVGLSGALMLLQALSLLKANSKKSA